MVDHPSQSTENTPNPISLRNNPSAQPPSAPQPAQPRGTTVPAFAAGILIAVVIMLALYSVLDSDDSDSLSEDDVRNIVSEAIGTQNAMQPVALAEDGEAASADGAAAAANSADIQQMVDDAVGTQVAMLVPTNTPLPPTPTMIPSGVAEDDDAFLGAEDAPVVIVEFSDFQCGYCGRWYQTTLPEILEAYPDEVKFVYRDFPIFGEDSLRAALATECAEEQDPDAFWEMHNRLFERLNNQESTDLSEDSLVGFAEEIGLDTDSFAECLSSQKYYDEVLNDYRTASEYGLGGTPGFVINGVVYAIGAQSFEVFDQIIQSELADADVTG